MTHASRDDDYAAYVSARWPALVRAAALLGCARPEAEDLVQTVLVKCYVSWPKVRRAADVDSYVYRMLVNAHATSRRRRWWAERPTAEPPVRIDDVDPFAVSDLADALRRALDALPQQARVVVVLRCYLDLSEQQTADVLAVPVGTVKSRLSRALARLADDPNLKRSRDGEAP